MTPERGRHPKMPMKHSLSAFRRSRFTSFFLLAILAFMLAPVGAFAAVSGSGFTLPVASMGGFNMALCGIGATAGVVAYGLRNKASEEGDGGGGAETPNAAEALAKIEDKTLPMGQRLQVAAAALRGVDPTGQLATVKQSLTDAQAALAAKETELQGLQSQLTDLQNQLAAREADVKSLEESNAKLEQTNKDLQSKEQDVDKRASAKAKEQVAALGFPAANLPAPNSELSKEIPQTAEAKEEALKECKTQQERSALLRSWKAQQA